MARYSRKNGRNYQNIVSLSICVCVYIDVSDGNKGGKGKMFHGRLGGEVRKLRRIGWVVLTAVAPEEYSGNLQGSAKSFSRIARSLTRSCKVQL